MKFSLCLNNQTNVALVECDEVPEPYSLIEFEGDRLIVDCVIDDGPYAHLICLRLPSLDAPIASPLRRVELATV
jgi:hypothetical protein